MILVLVMILGLVTSYTDYFHGKVRNMHLMIAFLIGVGAYILYGGIPEWVNFLIALGTGFLLWEISVWTSGDAKLYAAYALLIPLSIYQIGYVPLFPSITVLINTFVPFFLFYFAKLVFYAPKKSKMKALKRSLNPKRVIILAIILFALMWPVALMSQLLSFNLLLSQFFSNFFIRMLILFFIVRFLESSLKLNILVITVLISLLRLLLDKSIYSIMFVNEFLMTILVFMFARFFLLDLTYSIYVRHVDLHLLKPGMIPAERIFKDKDNYKKEPLLFHSLISYLRRRRTGDLLGADAEGLSEEDCRRLRKLKREGKLDFNHLRVHQTLPFAIFLFIGVLITIIVRGNLFILLWNLNFR